MQANTKQTQYAPRALVVDELMRVYEADANAMYENVQRIAVLHGLVQCWERVSDDDAEEMVKEALGV
jgi:hypothetical protein